MIDRDSYTPGARGYDEFLADARAVLKMIQGYVAFDTELEVAMNVADAQRLVDGARRSMAGTAVDELAALADLMADTAREFDAPIEEDLRAAKRLIDMTYGETTTATRVPAFRPVETLLFDPTEIPEFRSWRREASNIRRAT